MSDLPIPHLAFLHGQRTLPTGHHPSLRAPLLVCREGTRPCSHAELVLAWLYDEVVDTFCDELQEDGSMDAEGRLPICDSARALRTSARDLASPPCMTLGQLRLPHEIVFSLVRETEAKTLCRLPGWPGDAPQITGALFVFDDLSALLGVDADDGSNPESRPRSILPCALRLETPLRLRGNPGLCHAMFRWNATDGNTASCSLVARTASGTDVPLDAQLNHEIRSLLAADLEWRVELLPWVETCPWRRGDGFLPAWVRGRTASAREARILQGFLDDMLAGFVALRPEFFDDASLISLTGRTQRPDGQLDAPGVNITVTERADDLADIHRDHMNQVTIGWSRLMAGILEHPDFPIGRHAQICREGTSRIDQQNLARDTELVASSYAPTGMSAHQQLVAVERAQRWMRFSNLTHLTETLPDRPYGVSISRVA